MFMAALFTIAKTWKQPKLPSTEDWIKMMWYIHTMEYYSAKKKNERTPEQGIPHMQQVRPKKRQKKKKMNEIMSFAVTWMDLQITLSEVSQRQIHEIANVWNLMKNNIKNLQSRNRLKDYKTKILITKGELWVGE